tara:strand:+ start:13610 stop:14086 length:477 start_codon:yes stop_codon:yes gene_type:complete
LIDRKIILVIGNCGSGKTWVMRQVKGDGRGHKKLGKFVFHENDKCIIVGKYAGHVFDGSDRLSMSVMTDLDHMIEYIRSRDKITFFEGDRFMNKTFIKKCHPFIIKILDSGKDGRNNRGSNQTDRQIKAIQTRVSKISADKEVLDSNKCLALINRIIG